MSKIVIVDDSIDLLEVMKFFLEEKGYEVETASRHQNLISLIKSFSPDLNYYGYLFTGRRREGNL